MISLVAALETCEYELICITLHKWGKIYTGRRIIIYQFFLEPLICKITLFLSLKTHDFVCPNTAREMRSSHLNLSLFLMNYRTQFDSYTSNSLSVQNARLGSPGNTPRGCWWLNFEYSWAFSPVGYRRWKFFRICLYTDASAFIRFFDFGDP